MKRRTTTVAISAALAGLAIAVAGCGGSSDATGGSAATAASGGAATAASGGAAAGTGTSGGSTAAHTAAAGSAQLALVAYSTPKKAYDALTGTYAQTSGGKGITFTQSFGPSGAQSRAVAAGQPADVVAFSTEPDITRLVKAGLVASDWNSGPQRGIVADSVVVMVVRKGNPKHIAGWDDLVKPGIKVITPNPSTSGSARWNILAGYGAELKEGKSKTEALAYLRTLLTKNTAAQPSSASSALQGFTSGEGDVLLDYESDAISAVKAGDAVQYVVPKQTLLIQTPIAVLAKGAHKAQAQAFVSWLLSPAGQTIWAQKGYRPVDPAVAAKFASTFPTPPQLFTIATLGGWKEVKKSFFDPSAGSITRIEEAAGVPTASS